jgi:hypothetical protein
MLIIRMAHEAVDLTVLSVSLACPLKVEYVPLPATGRVRGDLHRHVVRNPALGTWSTVPV